MQKKYLDLSFRVAHAFSTDDHVTASSVSVVMLLLITLLLLLIILIVIMSNLLTWLK